MHWMVGEQEWKRGGNGFPFPSARSSWVNTGQCQFSALTCEMGLAIPTFHLLTLLGGNPFGETLALPTGVKDVQFL